MGKSEMTYAEAMAEIEAILAKMNEANPDIDALAGQVRRAGELIRFCRERLRKAERRWPKRSAKRRRNSDGSGCRTSSCTACFRAVVSVPAGGGRPVRRIFRLPPPHRQGETAGAGARSASPLRLEGEARGEGERGGQLGGFVHGPAVDSIVPVEFSVVYHDAEAEMKGPAFSQAERHTRFRAAVKPGRLSVRDGAARVVGEMANGSSS